MPHTILVMADVKWFEINTIQLYCNNYHSSKKNRFSNVNESKTKKLLRFNKSVENALKTER